MKRCRGGPLEGLPDLRAAESKFAPLDRIPERLYAAVVTHTHGDLPTRVRGVLQWRAALLEGRLPAQDRLIWPAPAVRRAILMRLEALAIAPFCREQADLTDSILEDILEGIDEGRDPRDSLRERAAPMRADGRTQDDYQGADAGTPSRMGEPGLGNVAGEGAEPFAADAGACAAARLDRRWRELAQCWHELAEGFDALGGLLGRGWDLTQGVLAAQGWRDVVRYRKLIEGMPELKKLVATLGRLHEACGMGATATASERIFQPVRRRADAMDPARTPRAAMETGGILRGDDVARLLPGELALLGHPKMKMLWHAKRAERTLLSYHLAGVLSDHIPAQEGAEVESSPAPRPSDQVLGPIMVCLDTSGSMHGEPEHIAKALVLEALRIAWQERRRCHVFSFGGPGEVIEHELDLTRGGLGKLLKFLGQSFHGGTDAVEPLLKALDQQGREGWHEADILLVTDGRFPLLPGLLARIGQAKTERGLRVHGVLLGSWYNKALDEICQPLHRFGDWLGALSEREDPG